MPQIRPDGFGLTSAIGTYFINAAVRITLSRGRKEYRDQAKNPKIEIVKTRYGNYLTCNRRIRIASVRMPSTRTTTSMS